MYLGLAETYALPNLQNVILNKGRKRAHKISDLSSLPLWVALRIRGLVGWEANFASKSFLNGLLKVFNNLIFPRPPPPFFCSDVEKGRFQKLHSSPPRAVCLLGLLATSPLSFLKTNALFIQYLNPKQTRRAAPAGAFDPPPPPSAAALLVWDGVRRSPEGNRGLQSSSEVVKQQPASGRTGGRARRRRRGAAPAAAPAAAAARGAGSWRAAPRDPQRKGSAAAGCRPRRG